MSEPENMRRAKVACSGCRDRRPCERCHGTGRTNRYHGATNDHPGEPYMTDECNTCHGTGVEPEPTLSNGNEQP